MKRVLALLLIVLPIANSEAALSHLADQQWLTVSGEHFNIHYPKGREAMAAEVMTRAEAVRERLQRFMNWIPDEAVDIILSDEADLPNGWATMLPSNRIGIYLSPPDSIGGLEDDGGWIDTVITHEYTHILHLDKAHGVPAKLRKFFGRFGWLFPNSLQPTWFIEGLATYQETDKARGIGRGQSSYYRMLMRMEYENGIKPLRQVNQPLVSLPRQVPYLYGVYFYQYLHERYGEAKIRQMIESYSDNMLPFAINSNSRQVFGKDLDGLWSEFERYLKKEFAPELQRVQDEGETRRNHLTADGYYKRGLQRADDGTLFLIQGDDLERTQLVAYRPQADGGYRPESLGDTLPMSRLHWHKTAGLLLTELQICDNVVISYDLIRVDPSSGERELLSACGRYRNALWSADGNSIIAVRSADDSEGDQLLRLNSDGALESILWQGHEHEVIGPLAISPDGQLVASLWQRDRGWDLALFDRQSASWHSLTHNSSIESDPQFVDEKTLLFTSDSNGIYNVHRLDLESGEIVRISNLSGGGFAPVAGSGDTIFYLDYRSGGTDLVAIAADQQVASRVKEDGRPSAITEAITPVYLPEGVAYSPWSSMRPRWWLPDFFISAERTELGFMTGGADLLNRHTYSLSLSHDFKNGRNNGEFSYVYDRYFPIFKLDIVSQIVEKRDDDGELLSMRSNRGGGAEVIFPFLSNRRSASLHIGIVRENRESLWEAAGNSKPPERDDTVAGVALSYASATYQPRLSSLSDGIDALLVAESSDLVEDDYEGSAMLVDLRGFSAPIGRSVIALQMMQGVAAETARPFELGGLGGLGSEEVWDSSNSNSPFNRRSASLRGYPEGLPQLSGSKMRKGVLELRLPIAQIERGWMAPPIGIHKVHATLFTEAGAAWDAGSRPDGYYRSYGAELNVDMVLFYNMVLPYRLGVVKGIDEGGESQVYLRIGGAF